MVLDLPEEEGELRDLQKAQQGSLAWVGSQSIQDKKLSCPSMKLHWREGNMLPKQACGETRPPQGSICASPIAPLEEPSGEGAIAGLPTQFPTSKKLEINI